MQEISPKNIPLIVVEGFLGHRNVSLWGSFEKYLNVNSSEKRRVIIASVGPVSSLHDRACELFYSLKGGTVDYGEKHSNGNGHARYGRTFSQGLYPSWSKDQPLHFLGHSVGGPTIIKLQWLIATGFFGMPHHPDMLLSVTTVSAPFRGTQVVYILGERTDAAPAVRPFSLGDLLSKVVHIGSYLSPLLPNVFDFHTESRALSYQETSFSSFLRQLWHSDWAEGRDAAPFDVTFQAADEREYHREGIANPGTFYRSYAANMTVNSSGNISRRPSLGHALYAPGLCASSYGMSSFDFAQLNPPPSFVRDVDHNPQYKANDGVVPVFSQWHPLGCKSTHCRHLSDFPGAGKAVERGIWHVFDLPDANHLSIAPFWFNTTRQIAFWEEIGAWLSSIEDEMV